MTKVGGIWHGRGCSLRRCSAKAVRAELSSQLGGALSARSGSGATGEQKERQRGLEERGRAQVAKHRSHGQSCCTRMAMADKDDAVLHVIQNDHSYASVLSPRVSRHDLHRSPVSQHAAAASLETVPGCIWSALVKLDRLCSAWVRCPQLGLANAMPASLRLAGAAQRPRRVAELHAFSCCSCDA